ncbi:MAG: DUF2442 domain-containing protein [Magnetococcales bacterium]|nr:DUF2442 domain-containing protein [Magnetococcales bacterium]
MTPEILEVAPLPDYHLELRFADGEVRLFDARPYLERGIFQKLRNPHLFSQARVALGTVTWPGEMDLAPETLYLRSTPVSSSPRP